jgi:AGZA family xanthine/uracil permease-like MFS transporter
MDKFLGSFFRLKERKTTVKTEMLAGAATFLTMAYIIFVEPAVLKSAGMDFGAVMTATCIGAALICILMGTVANYPIAGAPLMGENFFFVFTIVMAMKFTWQQALAAVLIEGILFLLLTSFKLREMIIDSIPESLKNAMAIAIGLFIAFIGLKWAGIIVTSQATSVALGSLHSPAVATALAGLFITAVLIAKKINGSLLWGMGASLIVALILRVTKFTGVVSLPPSIEPVFMKFDFSQLANPNFIAVILILLYMEIFDTIGTIIGVSKEAGFEKNGKFPGIGKVLFVDALGTSLGAFLGTSTVSSYIESNAGVTQGARTGLASVTTGILFLLALFFYPFVQMIGGGFDTGGGNYIYPIAAPALIMVGFLMIKHVVKLDFKDATEAIPAYLTIIGVPLTYNIADGIAFGIISYPLLKLATGRGKEVSILMYILAGIFILKYIFVKI